MFFSLVRKNGTRGRKENGLLFVSLITSIVAFYIVLSLENQDVIRFLRTMESDAVHRLLTLIPVLYVVSLFILFFLVYFTGAYQIERRSHELGMYLMLGMRRRKLFLMLLVEDLWHSVLSLLIGIPIAVFLSEMMSMITAKVVGLGILGHQFSLSISAIVWTVVGYVAIRLVALFIISGRVVKREIMQLLVSPQDDKRNVSTKGRTGIKLLIGIALLGIAYTLAVKGYVWESASNMAITLAIGISGTFLLFHGIGLFLSFVFRNSKHKNGLAIFTFRQLQENVFLKSNSLAISSLLVFMALCCFGAGISIYLGRDMENKTSIHYTFVGTKDEVQSILQKSKVDAYVDKIFTVRIGRAEVDSGNLIKAFKKQPKSSEAEVLLRNLEMSKIENVISVSGYNDILRANGMKAIQLQDHQVALYNGRGFDYGVDILKEVVQHDVTIETNGETYRVAKEIAQERLVANRAIHIAYAFIVPDDVFSQIADAGGEEYRNVTLQEKFIRENGLFQSLKKVNEKLAATGTMYDSYLHNIGRQLIYKVAASYITLYMGMIFLIIANTVIGVQFLMQQQKTTKRYETIIHLGCNAKQLRQSARKQIKWYFTLPIVVAVMGSVFGIMSLFKGVLSPSMQPRVGALFLVAIPVLLVLCLIEFCYIKAVMKISDKKVTMLMDRKRIET